MVDAYEETLLKLMPNYRQKPKQTKKVPSDALKKPLKKLRRLITS